MLLPMIIEVMKDRNVAPIISDWLEEHHSSHHELQSYLKKFRRPRTLDFVALTECVTKFGSKTERKVMRKLVTKMIEQNLFSRKRAEIRAEMKSCFYLRSYSRRFLEMLVWET